MILLNLKPGHVLKKAQLACRGFKRSMESSPTFQRRAVIATRGVNLDWSSIWSVAPKCMSIHYDIPSRLVLKLVFTAKLSFEQHRANASFRKLCVSDVTPQRIEVLWHEGATVSGLSNEMLWLTAQQGEKITFGKIFDAVAAKVPAGRKVGGLLLFLFKDRASFGRPNFC